MRPSYHKRSRREQNRRYPIVSTDEVAGAGRRRALKCTGNRLSGGQAPVGQVGQVGATANGCSSGGRAGFSRPPNRPLLSKCPLHLQDSRLRNQQHCTYVTAPMSQLNSVILQRQDQSKPINLSAAGSAQKRHPSLCKRPADRLMAHPAAYGACM